MKQAVSCLFLLFLLMFLGLFLLHCVGVCGQGFVFWSFLSKCLNECIEKLRYLSYICFETEKLQFLLLYLEGRGFHDLPCLESTCNKKRGAGCVPSPSPLCALLSGAAAVY